MGWAYDPGRRLGSASLEKQIRLFLIPLRGGEQRLSLVIPGGAEYLDLHDRDVMGGGGKANHGATFCTALRMSALHAVGRPEGSKSFGRYWTTTFMASS